MTRSRAFSVSLAALLLLDPASAGIRTVPRPRAPVSTSAQPRERSRADLVAAIADVEAGRRTTPLIGEPTGTGEVTVTFLAKRDGNRLPRIASDATGWGEHIDGTFDVTIGRMTRVGRTGWYALETTVASGGRIEYRIAYGTTDYRLNPHNPRKTGPPTASEFVVPGYLAPREIVDPPVSPGGVLAEHFVESVALGQPCKVTVNVLKNGAAPGTA